jgi:uncharacterized protein (DUF1778 family)
MKSVLMEKSKDERIHIRITQDEKEIIQAAAKILKLSMAEFIRELSVDVARGIVLKRGKGEVLSAFSATAGEIISRVPQPTTLKTYVDETTGAVKFEEESDK